MGELPRHPNKELREVIEAAHRQGWRVTRGKSYFMMKCPCPLLHKKTVKLSPSNPNYGRELKRQLARTTCWEEQS